MSEHQAISVDENTTAVIDLDCGESTNPNFGTDICVLTHKENNTFGEDTEKPTSYVLGLGELSETLVTSATGDAAKKVNEKVKVGAIGGTDDDDDSYYVVVSKDSDPSKTDNLFFQGTVEQGENFVASGDFGSETYVHIYSAKGGSLLQTINFHTSCSSPLIVGDQYGSITLEGATLEGKDSGTTYTVGATEDAGDLGVIYKITGGADFGLFNVNEMTGEVSFKNPPDYEDPKDQGTDNVYEVVVTAFRVDEDGNETGEVCEEKKLQVTVEDDCINVLENTSPVIADLDCGEEENPDLDKDICVERDNLKDKGIEADKPNQLTLTLNDTLESIIDSAQQGNKLEVDTFDFDVVEPNATGVFIRVSDSDKPGETDKVYFEGDVGFGESFTAMASAAGEDKFGSETYIHIFSSDGGQLLQTINYHTSCSAPIVIGDEIGLVSVDGVGLLNKDTGGTIEFGVSDAPGDEGVVYEITQNEFDEDGNPIFQVDPDTGEVTFINPPDYENPQDANGDNKYDVEVTAFFVDENGVKTGEICEVKKLEICVEDELDELCIDENPTPGEVVADVDLTVVCPKPADVGDDICVIKEELKDQGIDTDKPTELTLTLGDALTSAIMSSQKPDKVEANLANPALEGTTDDGTVFIRVSDSDDPLKTDKVYFSQDVDFGESFTATAANAGEDKFGSETFVHIFDKSGGQLLQTIQFHTSCSQPLVFGDQYGSVSLTGAALVDKDTGETLEFGGTTSEELGEGDIVYSLSGPDAAYFEVDHDTGEVTVKESLDFENPQDMNGDNVYEVIVRAEAKDDPTCFTEKPLEICVQDVPELGSLSGRYFCDTNDNDVDDGQATDPGIAGVLVTLLDAAGNPVLDAGSNPVTTTTGAQGQYSFGGLEPGTYGVQFTDPNGVLAGKQLVEPNVENKTTPEGTGDEIDSDAIGDTTSSEITGIVVEANQDTPDNDAGAEYTAALGDKVFFDLDRDGLQDAGEPGVAGVTVTLTGGGPDGTIGTSDDTSDEQLTNAAGEYLFEGLDPGTEYKVTFSNLPAGTAFTLPNVGTDDAIDSDANPMNGMTQIVTLDPGEVNRTLDAGIVSQLGSISGRFFLDDGPDPDRDCDGLDNDGPDGAGESSPPVVGAKVWLIAPGGTILAMTETGANGEYRFDDLEPGSYRVRFEGQNGTSFTEADVGTDDTIDSDATFIGTAGNGNTDFFDLAAGENKEDVDAGICLENVPQDDEAKVCAYLENDPNMPGTVVIDVLANDEGQGLTITRVDGDEIALNGSVDLDAGGKVTLIQQGGSQKLLFSADSDFDNVEFGTTALSEFTYEVSDSFGFSSIANVDVTVCGAKNTVASIFDAIQDLPVSSFVVDNDAIFSSGYEITVSGTGNSALDGQTFTAYCLNSQVPTSDDIVIDARVFPSTDADGKPNGDLEGKFGIPAGFTAVLDSINWILNQQFVENGTYTGWEVQAAIWEFTNGNVDDEINFDPGDLEPEFQFVDTIADDAVRNIVAQNLTSDETRGNVIEIIKLAASPVSDGGGDGYVVPDDGIVGLIFDPEPGQDSLQQPFIIPFDGFDCVC